MAIAEVVERVLNALPNGSASTLDEVLAADAEARRLASEFAALLTADAPQAERVLH
jgi:1-deoxy-D-xylulose-5-phosphate reductoisomerase